ncbi:MAG: hypothetical protein ACFNJL_08575, partial [Selenomonas sp.]
PRRPRSRCREPRGADRRDRVLRHLREQIRALGLALAHIDTLPAMGFAVGCLSGTGTVVTLLYGGKDFLLLPGWVKVFAGFLMILGRLEIFSFLILLRAGIDRLHRRQW